MRRAKGERGESRPEVRLSTLWGPGPLSSGPADGRKQAEFTSAVKRSGRRASSASVQRVWSRRGVELLLISARSEIIPPAPPCFCFAASLLQQDRVNGKIMLEAMGEGGIAAGRRSLNALGPRATSEARPTAASSRNSLPALNAAAVVQALRQYSVSGADVRLRYSGVGKYRPADGRKQAEFTSAVKRGGRRASPASVQRVWSRRAVELLLISARSEIIPPAPPLFLPPGFAGSAGQGEREDYAQSKGRKGGE